MAEAPSSFDPARTLALLWGAHPKTGRSGLNVKTIVGAAIAVADQEGLNALSMRRVAEHLKVGTMSLYTHVSGKPELTELMIDTVYGELYVDADEPARQTGGWRNALAFVAIRNWDLYHKHPWLLDLPGARPVLGPNATLKYEAELRPLDGIGLTDVEMDAVLTLILTHVEGSARIAVNQARAHQESGMTDTEWWTQSAPLLEKVMDARRFPTASRVGQAAGEAYGAAFDPQHALHFGLRRIMDGTDALVASRSR
ncbi:TetR/AcrR family transcriptional regulator C-terminal domain-containing protein [Deinococcus cellulosilyticus]|uniref:TetR family transcriptional regulator n=1 Tax=Deinococcus cellulosilyticus (strain DSM 18568 / NBRC 106333 / KACC 11606 / 5516J-15) TaxID=1223518 RepID=A0A511N9U5_DEIC1|nr:TetR/AcrR family transcriptional regulator C-terminal domain-containing protein [Deinococcus cellulosilyticus]GEM49296.1 TetR family transcriptional regulator [Deinococcus cellulosilyticus NBRC 106333 = KACC 11606]